MPVTAFGDFRLASASRAASNSLAQRRRRGAVSTGGSRTMPKPLLLAAALVLLAAPAWAAPSVALQGRADVLKALSACRTISDAAARLDCFDKASAALDQAEASGDVVIVDRAQARAARRQAFGFNLSALSVFDRALAKDEVNSLTTTAESAYQNADGKWIIVLEDGARWRQIDDEVLNRRAARRLEIKIRHASLGSFVMNIDGQPYIRVHRDE